MKNAKDEAGKKEVMLDRMTRREAREAMESGRLKAAIIPVGSIEQHLEHLEMGHDIASSTYVARQAALRLYPAVVVVVPMSLGIAEHHMNFKISLSVKPGTFLTVLYDACESLLRHGIKNVLILNGHGGNSLLVQSSLNQFLLRFQENVHFRSYWDLIPKEIFEHQLRTKLAPGVVPGHANEFETAFAFAAFPESVRTEYIDDKGAKLATRECGQVLVEAAVNNTAQFLSEMIEGKMVAQIDAIVNDRGTDKRSSKE